MIVYWHRTPNFLENGNQRKCRGEQNQRIHDDIALIFTAQNKLDKTGGRKRRPQNSKEIKNITNNITTNNNTNTTFLL